MLVKICLKQGGISVFNQSNKVQLASLKGESNLWSVSQSEDFRMAPSWQKRQFRCICHHIVPKWVGGRNEGKALLWRSILSGFVCAIYIFSGAIFCFCFIRFLALHLQSEWEREGKWRWILSCWTLLKLSRIGQRVAEISTIGRRVAERTKLAQLRLKISLQLIAKRRHNFQLLEDLINLIGKSGVAK